MGNFQPGFLRKFTPGLTTKDMVTKEHTERIYHALPSAQLEFIEGTHFIASKKPAEFNQVVEQFLQS